MGDPGPLDQWRSWALARAGRCFVPRPECKNRQVRHEGGLPVLSGLKRSSG